SSSPRGSKPANRSCRSRDRSHPFAFAADLFDTQGTNGRLSCAGGPGSARVVLRSADRARGVADPSGTLVLVATSNRSLSPTSRRSRGGTPPARARAADGLRWALALDHAQGRRGDRRAAVVVAAAASGRGH